MGPYRLRGTGCSGNENKIVLDCTPRAEPLLSSFVLSFITVRKGSACRVVRLRWVKIFFFDAPFESHFIDLAFLCKSLPGNVFLTLLFDITLPYFNLVKGNYQIIRSSIFSSTYNYKEFDASAVKLPKL